MIRPSVKQLEHLCTTIPERLKALSVEDWNYRSAPGKWSRQQVLGHLIDSAANNHHRFVRGQFEEIIVAPYDQHGWNNGNYWEEQDVDSMIELWTVYNKHLTEVAKRLPQDRLDHSFKMADGSECTLGFLVDDYVAHLEHHLRQLVVYI